MIGPIVNLASSTRSSEIDEQSYLFLQVTIDWKKLLVGIVPGIFFLTDNEPWNNDRKWLFVGTVPANFCHWGVFFVISARL